MTRNPFVWASSMEDKALEAGRKHALYEKAVEEQSKLIEERAEQGYRCCVFVGSGEGFDYPQPVIEAIREDLTFKGYEMICGRESVEAKDGKCHAFYCPYAKEKYRLGECCPPYRRASCVSWAKPE